MRGCCGVLVSLPIITCNRLNHSFNRVMSSNGNATHKRAKECPIKSALSTATVPVHKCSPTAKHLSMCIHSQQCNCTVTLYNLRIPPLSSGLHVISSTPATTIAVVVGVCFLGQPEMEDGKLGWPLASLAGWLLSHVGACLGVTAFRGRPCRAAAAVSAIPQNCQIRDGHFAIIVLPHSFISSIKCVTAGVDQVDVGGGKVPNQKSRWNRAYSCNVH